VCAHSARSAENQNRRTEIKESARSALKNRALRAPQARAAVFYYVCSKKSSRRDSRETDKNVEPAKKNYTAVRAAT